MTLLLALAAIALPLVLAPVLYPGRGGDDRVTEP
ncbi:hypothetical protein HNQ07_000142 [Deinococcus metalli]|uniref:Uncharacterized protein n=1 Tax=Deinococcus metalli TaxID=1141878 RepID=A0A7W8KBI7_9DEIO|nr:hypothetical protein [Deinococcus metalli]